MLFDRLKKKKNVKYLNYPMERFMNISNNRLNE